MISEELLQSFIAEASDLLDDIEPSLIEYSRLENSEERIEIVNRVFRHFHSIKGSAGFVGLHNIARLTHEAETLLEQFRKTPETVINQEHIALLCHTVDLLRAIFESGGGDEQEDNEELGIDSLIREIAVVTQAIKTELSKKRSELAAAEEETLENTTEDVDSTWHGDTTLLGQFTSAPEPTTEPGTEKKETKSGGTDTRVVPRSDIASVAEARTKSIARTRRLSSDTARIIHTSQRGPEKKLTSSEFVGKYVSEANDLLEQTEQSLLYAEQHPDAGGDAVQEALRCLHSFKGNSGLMNLTDLERLSHRMESEVENNIGRSLGLDSQMFDVLLQMIDVLRQGVLDFSCGGSGAIPEADAYIVLMDEFSRDRDTNSLRRTGESVRDTAMVLQKTMTENANKPSGSTTRIRPRPSETKRMPKVTSAAEPVPEKTKNEQYSDEQETRNATDTTRLVLRGDASEQVNLNKTPKTKKIAIDMGAVPAVTPPSVAAAEKTREQPAKKKTETNILSDKDGRKRSDTGQRRRAAEQFSARSDIRVDLRKLDEMLNLVGELVIAEAMVTRHPVVRDAENESLERAVHQLRRVASSLQDMATSVRMIPLSPTFRRMTRLVYDLSGKANKKIDLVLLGEETEVDRTVIERISDPLVHIIRNAIDHGIETPEERVKLGKPEVGRLTIEGHHEGGEVWIVITDDGKGLDRDAILQRAISRGLITGDGSDLADNQIYRFIFEPGFSTARQVTDISGRGFGMDVVKKNIEKLSGKIDIRTRPGEGTAVVMRIPLTLAIIEGMLISSGDTRYIIPLLSIRESLRPDPAQIMTTPDGQELVKLRDELIPIVKLDETFTRVKSDKTIMDGILVIVEGEDGSVVALFADELLGQQETVIKGLSGWLKRSRGVSGCTILGDGEVGLILDIGAIVRLARQKHSA